MPETHTEQALLTIITVTYNNLAELKKTYRSIAQQSCLRFRWLVVDGGSEDGTVSWLEGLSFPPLQFLSEPDQGIYFAMNKGIALYETEYCQFLNAGDSFYDDQVLASVLQLLDYKRPVFAYGAYIHGGVPGYPDRLRRCHLRSRWELLLGTIPCHQTMFYSRRAFDEFRLFDTSIVGGADLDWLLGFMTLYQPGDFLYFDFPIVCYDPHGLSYQQFFRLAPMYHRILQKESNPLAVGAGVLGWLRAATHVVVSKSLARFGK